MPGRTNRLIRVSGGVVVLSTVLTMASTAAVAQTTAAPYLGITPSSSTARALEGIPGEIDEQLPYGLYGSVGISAVYETNPARAPQGSEDDWAVVIPGSLTYRQNFGKHRGLLTYGTTIGRYGKTESENFNNHALNGIFTLDITRLLDANLHASWAQGFEQRGAPGTRPLVPLNQERDKVEVTGYGANVVLGRQESRLGLTVGGDKNQWRYKNNNQQFRDRDEDRVYARAGVRVGWRTTAFVQAEHRDIDYLDPAQNIDSEEDTYWGGIAWRATAITNGELKIGRSEKTFDDPSLGGADTTVYDGRLNWRPRPFWGFQLYGARTFSEPTGPVSNATISNLLGVRSDYQFATQWNVFGYYNYIKEEFEGSIREDKYNDFGLGIGKTLTNWLSLSLQAGRTERNSNVPGLDYENEYISINLSSDFTIFGNR